jgi:hypothetical protein
MSYRRSIVKAVDGIRAQTAPLTLAEQMARLADLRIALTELVELHRAAWDRHLREAAESFANWGESADSHR